MYVESSLETLLNRRLMRMVRMEWGDGAMMHVMSFVYLVSGTTSSVGNHEVVPKQIRVTVCRSSSYHW